MRNLLDIVGWTRDLTESVSEYATLLCIPYSWKIWRFGVLYYNRQIKSAKISYSYIIYTYGDPVPNRQI